MNHKRAVRNYQIILKLENFFFFSPQDKFKYSHAALTDKDAF